MAGTDIDIRKLFASHQYELQVYLTRILQDGETAIDLTQETFLRVVEHMQRNKAKHIINMRSYLYRTAHNLAIDHLRAKERDAIKDTPSQLLENVPNSAPTPEKMLSAQSEISVVERALEELPEKTRNVFFLTRIEGLTHQQAALQLKMSNSSVQKHLSRAVAHVMGRLREM